MTTEDFLLVCCAASAAFVFGWGYMWAGDHTVTLLLAPPDIICIANTRGVGMDCIRKN